MTPDAAFSVELIETSRAGYAALAASRLLENDRGLAERWGDEAFERWRANLEQRLRDLSVAVEEGRPQQFVDQVGWAKVAFHARGVPVSDLRASLVALRVVLEEELPENAREPALGCLDRALATLDGLRVELPSRLTADSGAGRLAAEYMRDLLEGERRAARERLLGAVRDGRLSVGDAIARVCLPAQAELGRLWLMNEISVAEEHFVSATTIDVMAQLVALAEPPAPIGRTLVAAAVEDDAHDIGLRAVSHLFELDGWRVVYLGALVPTADLVHAAGVFGADLVVLAATLVQHRRAVAAAIGALAEAGVAAPVLVGGAGFEGDDALWRDLGAAACAATAAEAPAVGRRLVGAPPS